jgi:hypothetical protein
MSGRSYTLVEVPVEHCLWPDHDLIVRVMEHVRQNLHALVPALSREVEVDLLATGTAHNIEPRPVLGLHEPPGVAAQVPDFMSLYKCVSDWCDQHSDAELREIGRRTDAPTWSDLVSAGMHPRRQ